MAIGSFRPYFDPTVRFQGGSVFSSYLEAFIKERGAMNKQLMEASLQQADPSFLQDQILLITKNIAELEKAKAKAAGGSGLDKTFLNIYSKYMGIEGVGTRMLGVEAKKSGGRAREALNEAESVYNLAKLTLSQAAQNKDNRSFTQMFVDEAAKRGMNSSLEKDALAVIANEKGPTEIDLEEAGLRKGADRNVFTAQYIDVDVERFDADTALAKTKAAVGGAVAGQPVDTSAIDASIASYKKSLKKLQEQLEDLDATGVSPFAAFSGNYMLDNPFTVQGFQQDKVDALAYSINQANRMEDRGLLREPLQEVEPGRREIASVGLKKPGETNEQYRARIAAAAQRRAVEGDFQDQRRGIQQARKKERKERQEFGLGPGSMAVLGAQAAGQSVGQGVQAAGRGVGQGVLRGAQAMQQGVADAEQFFMDMVDNQDVDAGGFDRPGAFGGPQSINLNRTSGAGGFDTPSTFGGSQSMTPNITGDFANRVRRRIYERQRALGRRLTDEEISEAIEEMEFEQPTYF